MGLEGKTCSKRGSSLEEDFDNKKVTNSFSASGRAVREKKLRIKLAGVALEGINKRHEAWGTEQLHDVGVSRQRHDAAPACSSTRRGPDEFKERTCQR